MVSKPQQFYRVLDSSEWARKAGECWKKELLRRFSDCNDFCPDKPFWVWFPASQFACWRNSVITQKIKTATRRKMYL